MKKLLLLFERLKERDNVLQNAVPQHHCRFCPQYKLDLICLVKNRFLSLTVVTLIWHSFLISSSDTVLNTASEIEEGISKGRTITVQSNSLVTVEKTSYTGHLILA